jgi:sugar phosphate isomerase/epimerase
VCSSDLEGEDQLAHIKESIKRARESFRVGFQVHAPLSDVNVGSVHEPMRRAAVNEIKQTLVLCRQLDIQMVTVHPGFIQGIAFLDKSRAFVKSRESLMEVARTAEDLGITVSVENMPGGINATCTQASELLEVIQGSGLGICFDMGHANTARQMDEMLALADRFTNVHLHNNEGQWDQHNQVDIGSGDLGKVVSVLKRQYKGNIIIEATDLESGIESKKILERLL